MLEKNHEDGIIELSDDNLEFIVGGAVANSTQVTGDPFAALLNSKPSGDKMQDMLQWKIAKVYKEGKMFT